MRSLRALNQGVVLVCLALATLATGVLAGDEEFTFLPGRLCFDGDRLAIRIPGQEPYLFDNLRLVTAARAETSSDDGPVGGRYSIQMRLNDRDETAHLYSLRWREVPERRCIGGTTVGVFRNGNGQTYAVWAINSRGDIDNSREVPQFLLHQMTQTGADRRWKYHRNGYAGYPFSSTFEDGFYVNSMGIVQLSPTEHYVFLHDDIGGRLAVGVTRTSDEIGMSAVGIPRDIPLPESFRRGLPFAEGGRIFWDRTERSLLVSPHAGEEFRTLLGLNLRDELDDRMLDPITRKERRRVLWSTGTRETFAFLERRARSAGSITLPPAIGAWVGASGTPKNGPSAPGVIDAVFLGLPNNVLKYRSEMGQELAYQLVESIAQRNPAREGIPLFYVPVPFDGSASSVGSIVRSQILTLRQRFGQQGRVQYLVLDLRFSPQVHAERVIAEVRDVVSQQVGITLNLMVLTGRDVHGSFLQRNADNELKFRSAKFHTMDDAISREVRLAVIPPMIHDRYNVSISSGTLSHIIAEVERLSKGNVQPLDDVDGCVQTIGVILSALGDRLHLDRAEDLAEVAQLYQKLSGERKPGPFDQRVLARVKQIFNKLAASSPTHIEGAFYDREDILRMVQREIFTWMAEESQHGRPNLVFTFVGDTRTGKTELTNRLARVLEGAFEVVNASAIDKTAKRANSGGSDYYGSGYVDPEALLIQSIKEKIERLWMNPNPVKILFLDEIDKFPQLLRTLLSAAGTADSRRGSVLNFNGLIVVLALNVDNKSETYQKLTQMELAASEYASTVTDLFVAAFSGSVQSSTTTTTGPIDPKTAIAVAGRLLRRMYFFRPASSSEAQQEWLIRDRLKLFAARHQCRFILLPAARKAMAERIQHFKKGNFGTMEEAIDFEVGEAVAEFRTTRGFEALAGKTLLLQPGDGKKEPGLVLRDLRHSPEGARYLIEETYRQLLHTVTDAVQHHIAEMRSDAGTMDGADQIAFDSIVRDYEVFVEAFTVAARGTLFAPPPALIPGRPVASTTADLQVIPGNGAVFPAAIEMIERPELLERMGGAARALFQQVYENVSSDPTAGTGDQAKVRESVLRQVGILLSTVIGMHREATSRQSGGGEDLQWTGGLVRIFERDRKGTADTDRRKAEVELMKTYRQKWHEVLAKIEGSKLERERNMVVTTFGKTWGAAVQELAGKHSGVDLNLLHTFLTALIDAKPGEERRAEEMIKEHEEGKKITGGAEGESASGVPDVDRPRIAAAYLLDNFVRATVASQLQTVIADSVRVVDGGAPALAPPGRCEAVISGGRFHHAGAEGLSHIFRRRN